MMWSYLSGLMIALGCLSLIDRKLKLAFWYDARISLQTIAATVGIFVVWDLLGIALGIFYSGGSAYSLPFMILPEFPIEELFFLVLLSYTTLLLYRGLQR